MGIIPRPSGGISRMAALSNSLLLTQVCVFRDAKASPRISEASYIRQNNQAKKNERPVNQAPVECDEAGESSDARGSEKASARSS